MSIELPPRLVVEHLAADQAGEGGPHDGALARHLGQPAGVQVDVIDGLHGQRDSDIRGPRGIFNHSFNTGRPIWSEIWVGLT